MPSLKPMLKYHLIYHDTLRSCVHLVVYHYTGPTFFTSYNLKLFSEFFLKTLFSVLPLFFLRINTSQKRLNTHLRIQLKHFINLASPNIKLWPFDRVQIDCFLLLCVEKLSDLSVYIFGYNRITLFLCFIIIVKCNILTERNRWYY